MLGHQSFDLGTGLLISSPRCHMMSRQRLSVVLIMRSHNNNNNLSYCWSKSESIWMTLQHVFNVKNILLDQPQPRPTGTVQAHRMRSAARNSPVQSFREQPTPQQPEASNVDENIRFKILIWPFYGSRAGHGLEIYHAFLCCNSVRGPWNSVTELFSFGIMLACRPVFNNTS